MTLFKWFNKSMIIYCDESKLRKICGKELSKIGEEVEEGVDELDSEEVGFTGLRLTRRFFIARFGVLTERGNIWLCQKSSSLSLFPSR